MRNYIFILNNDMFYASENIWINLSKGSINVFYHHFERYNTYDSHTYLEENYEQLLINI